MGKYFSHFPTMFYDAVQDGTSSPKVVTDILRRVKVRNEIKNNVSAFSSYRVPAGERPEDVSYKFYGTVDYYWIVLLMNNIKDRFYDWPLSEQQFNDYVNGKYTNPNAAHHYEVSQTSGPTSSLDNSHLIEVNSTESGASTVTNYEYERREQDKKSLIKVLKPEYISEFVEEFKNLIGD